MERWRGISANLPAAPQGAQLDHLNCHPPPAVRLKHPPCLPRPPVPCPGPPAPPVRRPASPAGPGTRSHSDGKARSSRRRPPGAAARTRDSVPRSSVQPPRPGPPAPPAPAVRLKHPPCLPRPPVPSSRHVSTPFVCCSRAFVVNVRQLGEHISCTKDQPAIPAAELPGEGIPRARQRLQARPPADHVQLEAPAAKPDRIHCATASATTGSPRERHHSSNLGQLPGGPWRPCVCSCSSK